MKQFSKVLYIVFAVILIGLVGYLIVMKQEKDTTAPQISFKEKEIEVSIETDEKDLRKGVNAKDDKDGDLSEQVFVESIKKQQNKDGFLITYAVFDKAGNMGKASRTLLYEDYSAPHFNMTEELKFSTEEKLNILEGVTVTDCIDGDLSQFIQIIGLSQDAQNMQVGDYKCKLEVENSLGDSAVLPVTVHIYEPSYEKESFEPQILLSQYLVYTKVGKKIQPMDYVKYVYDQKIKQIETDEEKLKGKKVETETTQNKPGEWILQSSISYEQNVKYDVPGTYQIKYSYTSESTGYTGTAELIVVVE
ncbi:hypothetical protein NDGK_03068 [Clostridiales bacterium CHKCI001]|nr:hypothetical protein NDGK_03068 [Clostridiales bacterium CHKCI001]